MIVNVVVVERLLDQQEVEVVDYRNRRYTQLVGNRSETGAVGYRVMAAPQQLFRQMRPDESRAARDQIRSHDLPPRLLILELSNADATIRVVTGYLAERAAGLQSSGACSS